MNEPQRPSTDINDPRTLAGAKRVASRRNNDVRRKLAKERAALPLLADQIPSEPETLVTPEEVIERRKLSQAAAWDNGVERDLAEIERIRRMRQVVFDMVTEAEYAAYYATSLECGFPLWAYWYNVKAGIVARLEPMPEIAEWLLTLLNDWEGEPPTHLKIHQKCGDGRTLKEISEALHWLEYRKYVVGGVLIPEPLAAFTASSGFHVTGYSTPWSITEAGRAYLSGGTNDR